MSIIQKIRERAAWIIIGAIAVALIAFIVQDAFVGRGRGLFSGNSTTIGTINGTKIDLSDYSLKLKKVEDMYTQQGYTVDDNMRAQQQEQIWNQYVDDAVIEKEVDRLGFDVTDKEVGDILYGDEPPQDFARQFTDPKTGQYDASRAYQQVQQWKRQKSSPIYKSFFGEYIPALISYRKREKLENMIAKSAYVPKWLIEKTSAENSQVSSFDYVMIPYSTINDSSVQVSDADVENYISKRKEEFKQEKARTVQYVTFSAAPSKADSTELLQHLESIRDTFAKTNDEATFLQQEYSQSPYYPSKISRKEIKIDKVDSIIREPVGSVYGPYIDQGSYVLAKLVSEANWPDTVKVRHILIATQQQQQNGQVVPIRTEEEAKRLVDSIANAIKTGSNFDSLCVKFSDDPGSKDSGGVYNNVTTGRMVAPFNEFIFSHHTGDKGVVKTDYGYHYIEILSQKGSSPAYQIAYLSRPIQASQSTIDQAQSLASQFAGESRDPASFKSNADKEHLQIFTAEQLKPMDYSINGLTGNARDVIRWAYRDADKGEVADRAFMVGDDFIVPILTQVYEKGTKPAEDVRPSVEFKIRNLKKARQIIEKNPKPASLQALATATHQPVASADSLSFSSGVIPNVGAEARVIGAAFNKKNESSVSQPLTGDLGVFYIRIKSLSAVANAGLDSKTQQSLAIRQQQMTSQRFLLPNLIQAADITDNRYKFY